MLDLFHTADILALRLIESDFLGPHCLGSGTDMKTGQRDITYERGLKKLTTEEANLWLKHINSEIIVTKVFEYTDKDTGKTYVRILFDFVKHDSEKDVVEKYQSEIDKNIIQDKFKILNNYRPAIKSCENCKHFFDYGSKVPTFCTHPYLRGKTLDDINKDYVCDLFEYKDEIDDTIDKQ